MIGFQDVNHLMMMFREGAEDCQFLMKSESLKDAIVGTSCATAQ